jgi:ankyrin repeat protein
LVQKFDDIVNEHFAEQMEEVEEAESTYPMPPTKMKLRQSLNTDQKNALDSGRPSKAKEAALAMETKQRSTNSGGKIRQMSQSLESDGTPMMKLKNDLAYNVDEKKVSEEDSLAYSQTTVHRLSEQFRNNEKPVGSPFGRPSGAGSDFFAQLRDKEGEEPEQNLAPAAAPGRVSDFFSQVRNDGEGSSRKSDGSRLPIQELASPARESDTLSDLSRESNLSGFWNRGRNSINALTTSLNTIAETHADKVPPEIKERASNVSGRVSGFFNKLRNQPVDESVVDAEATGKATSKQDSSNQNERLSERQQDQETPNKPISLSALGLLPSQSEDSHDALAAYRRKRETLSPDMDKNSDASSYHALPNQIREVVQNAKSSPALVSSAKERTETFLSPSASQSTTSQSTRSQISADKFREVSGKIVQNSALLGDYKNDSVIDTDDVDSDINGPGMDPQKLASLMMSPDVLQKRLKQAIQAIERRNWEQISYLINANPWLAEMKELTTNQFLLHKLAFFGGGPIPAPDDLCERLIEKFPSAVYKFDQDGNVPLHLAAAAGNLSMIEMLGERFESGASIRNEDGMLPLHFTIASLADFTKIESGSEDRASDAHALSLKIVKTVLKFFPKAIAIADNVGNIPLHVAAECLDGGVGVDVVYLLVDEAERQLSDPFGARFHNKVNLEEIVQEDMSTDKETESSVVDSEIHCSMVLNNYGETPLLSAVKSRKGWEIIEAILNSPGGHASALHQDANKNNALHLLVGDFQDPTAAMSILKLVPEAATVHNADGVLPIELACMHPMPEEVILGIALVDLPFNIDDQNGLKVHEGRGGSWYFLTCESDDHMVEIVKEIVSICSFQQLRELCFMTDFNSGNTVMERATPECRQVLCQSLRFLGRFEFVGDGPLMSNPDTGFKAFDAMDFDGDLGVEGKRVLLECYDNEETFERRVHTLLSVDLDNSFIEEVNVYVESIEDPFSSSEELPQQRCVSIERPQLTLDKVVYGMTGYQDNLKLRLKYAAKVCSVLRLIGKSLRHLHSSGIVHGNVCMETCGKFQDGWKLLERLDVQIAGENFNSLRFRQTFPPESLELSEQDGAIYDSDNAPVSFVKNLTAHPAIDVWAFGQICYEALVGKPLVDFDRTKTPSEDVVALLQIMEWNQSNMEKVFSDLLESGIEESGADLITSCLFANPDDRPSSMDEILEHQFWMDMRKHRSKRSIRRGIESMGSSISQSTEAETYEV